MINKYADASTVSLPQSTMPSSPRRRRQVRHHSPLELAAIPAPKQRVHFAIAAETPAIKWQKISAPIGVFGTALTGLIVIGGLNLLSHSQNSKGPTVAAEISGLTPVSAHSEAIVPIQDVTKPVFNVRPVDELYETDARDGSPSRLPTYAKPAVSIRVPQSLASPTMAGAPLVSSQESTVPETKFSHLADPSTGPDQFTCLSCVRSFSQYRGLQTDVFGGSQTQAKLLGDLGLGIRNSHMATIPVTHTQVRFFHAVDATAARDLAIQLNGRAVDLTWVATPNPAHNLEVWFAPDPNPD